MITVDVDMRALNSKLNRIRIATKEDVQKLLRQEGRLLAVELAKYTQPFGVEEAGKKQGEGAIRRDYGKVYPDAEGEFVADKVKAKARPKDKEGAKQRYLKYVRGGNTNAAMKMLDDMDISDHASGKTANPSYHKARWSRGVLKSGKSQIVIQRRTVTKLLNIALKMVGFAKGGWAVCARQLGGIRGIKSWVGRHKSAPGRVIDKSGDKKSPHITLINGINYTSQVLSQTSKSLAIKDRTIKLTERLNKILKAKLK